MIGTLVLFLTGIVAVGYFLILVLKHSKTKVSLLHKIVILAYFFSLFLFVLEMVFHNYEYHQALDPVDGNCYIPFGEKHIYSLLFYFVLFNIAAFLLWTKENKLPPIPRVIALGFVLIGFILSLLVLIQVFGHDTHTLDRDGNDAILFIFTPLFTIAFSIILFLNSSKSTVAKTNTIRYKSPFLNSCNRLLLNTLRLQWWAILLCIPILFICTLLLIIFGQDSNSLIKAFTDTATWTFSQKQHPPILDHTGHYLCTVAAKGKPSLVKPLFIGKRNGNPIIVNRQLQIANAFEELVFDFSPSLHHFIRKNYDKYGFNLSVYIHSAQKSNITYILMKPLEYLFLFLLYCFTLSPEVKISKQYRQ